MHRSTAGFFFVPVLSVLLGLANSSAAADTNVFYSLVQAAQKWQDANPNVCGQDTSTCGVQKMVQQFQACKAFRVVNGCPIGDQKTYGWTVALSINGALCSGTLVSPTHIVCAAHCVASLSNPSDASQITVYIGPRSLKAASTAQAHKVSRFSAHPAYNSERLVNDASILELSSPVTFDSNGIRPACLPTGPVPQTLTNLIVGGYGIDNYNKQTGAGTLRYTILSVQPDSVCKRDYGASQYNSTLTFCALGKRAGKGTDSCNGDSGSAVISKAATGNYAIVGIVSYGTDKCATAPGVYSDAYNCGIRASAAAIKRAHSNKRVDPCARVEKSNPNRPHKPASGQRKNAASHMRNGKKIGGIEANLAETIRLHGCTQNSQCVSNVCKEVETCRGRNGPTAAGHISVREELEREFRTMRTPNRRTATAQYRAGPAFTSVVQRPVKPVDEDVVKSQQQNVLRQRCSKINICWLDAWVNSFSSTPTFDFDAIAAEDVDDEDSQHKDVTHTENEHTKQ